MTAGAYIRGLFQAPPMTIALNLFAIGLMALVAVPLVDWAVVSAVWRAEDMNGCPPGSGACWAFIGSKLRLILFGRFPFDEQWRAALATAAMIGLVVLSLNPRFWRPWLGPVWMAGLALYAVLMWGGVFGLTFIESSYWGGLPLTVLLTVVGTFFGLVVAVPVALARYSGYPVHRWAATLYVELIRGVPLISVLFMASVLLPIFLPDGFTPNGLGRVMAGIVLFFAAYMAEVLRGGLQSIPSGQIEAARALGIAYPVLIWKIVLPQAFEAVLPAMVNLFIGALKGTSLVVIVAMMDLLGAAQASMADPKWIGFYVEAYAFAALVYVMMCGSISWYGRRIEKTLSRARAK